MPRTDRVGYGAGAAELAGDEARRLGMTRPLVVASRTLATTTDAVDELAARVGAAGIFHGVSSHVPRPTVLELAERCRELDADGLVSVGGGSPIDAAKAAALCISEGIEDEEGLAALRVRYRHPGPAEIPAITGRPPPHLALGTTLSGAEFTSIAGVTDPARGVKDLFTADALCPASVLLDPELAAHTPRSLWLPSGVRAIDHVVEGVYSVRHTPVTDAVLLGALEILSRDLHPSSDDPGDAGLRSRCQVAAWMAIMHLRNVSTGLSHGLGHQLGALLGVPHGVTSCILLPHAMDFNRAVTAGRQALLAPALGVETRGMDDERAAEAAVGALRALLVRMEVPTRLSDVGVERRHFAALVRATLDDMIVAGNPRPVTADDLQAVLEAAF
nr:iron-containing alcohol dehydrogenase [Pseudonocardia sp. C8]